MITENRNDLTHEDRIVLRKYYDNLCNIILLEREMQEPQYLVKMLKQKYNMLCPLPQERIINECKKF